MVSPFEIAITPNGKRAYVVCDDGVVVLETSTVRMTTVPVDGLSAGGNNSNGIAITPDGKRAYIGSRVIDIATNMVVGTFPGSDNEIAITPDGERAYVRLIPFLVSRCSTSTPMRSWQVSKRRIL